MGGRGGVYYGKLSRGKKFVVRGLLIKKLRLKLHIRVIIITRPRLLSHETDSSTRVGGLFFGVCAAPVATARQRVAGEVRIGRWFY